MAQFVLVSSGTGNSQFEKSMEIMNKSAGKVTFVPQPVKTRTGNHSGDEFTQNHCRDACPGRRYSQCRKI
jgi:hypothetical protein